MTQASTVLPPYAALASVYDVWTKENDYVRWASFIKDWLRRGPLKADSVLDLCCGTGLLTELLADAGFAVTGVDRSAQMLELAEARLSGRAELLQDELPQLRVKKNFDAAVCTFDSINYLAGQGELEAAMASVAQVLRPGGTFVFDVNTRLKLEKVFGASHYGDDLGDFAYVWRNRCDPSAHRTEFLITLFTQVGEQYTRYEERHVQRWFSAEELSTAARSAGFDVAGVYDDYGPAAASGTTLRETWVLRRATESGDE
ncbi:SAM-dependent methyltransferase [Streptomyces sp. SAI-144]|uniref:class I SAM-dependent DNA methyltransferase n=1 Tax=Streptomyces sp. SAI-144 TaxID=2940544 RepID=UPI002474F26A|nr:class I SAM-dependent methyltransferase [Streptomyces sp. SAI-144]MDH6435686.1 SAM-dependent methyltransferase [Streptomyces sp. SAI-144]